MKGEGHTQSIVMPPPPIRVPTSEGDRRPVGAAHTILTAILSLYPEALDWLPVPLATLALLSPPVTLTLFLTAHPQTTALIHTPNLTLGPHHRK